MTDNNNNNNNIDTSTNVTNITTADIPTTFITSSRSSNNLILNYKNHPFYTLFISSLR
jgi:hypothetical protein